MTLQGLEKVKYIREIMTQWRFLSDYKEQVVWFEVIINIFARVLSHSWIFLNPTTISMYLTSHMIDVFDLCTQANIYRINVFIIGLN